MLDNHHISVIIPALNEAESIPHLLNAIPSYVDDIILVDNGSTDKTAMLAAKHGARVISEPKRGYGKACLTGIEHLKQTDIIVFLDADLCDDPQKTAELCQPIIQGEYEFVLGSRMNKNSKQYLTIPQMFGNKFACLLMKWIWQTSYTDLGPFRAITPKALAAIHMQDENFGWTVEMQINAQHYQLRTKEIELPYYPRRYGQSKVSGTISGVWNAGTKILYVIAKSYFTLRSTSALEANH